jgi:hypothetical protein
MSLLLLPFPLLIYCLLPRLSAFFFCDRQELISVRPQRRLGPTRNLKPLPTSLAHPRSELLLSSLTISIADKKDDASVLSIPAMRRWNRILRGFTAEYLGLVLDGVNVEKRITHVDDELVCFLEASN